MINAMRRDDSKELESPPLIVELTTRQDKEIDGEASDQGSQSQVAEPPA